MNYMKFQNWFMPQTFPLYTLWYKIQAFKVVLMKNFKESYV